jgi:hypothetical protein
VNSRVSVLSMRESGGIEVGLVCVVGEHAVTARNPVLDRGAKLHGFPGCNAQCTHLRRCVQWMLIIVDDQHFREI